MEDLARSFGTLQRLNPALTSSHWLPEFSTYRRGLDYQNENRAYIDIRRQLLLEDSNIELFVFNSQGTDDLSLSLDAQRVVDFCNGRTEPSIRPDQVEDGEGPLIAWLDERAFENQISTSRAYRGPLTSSELRRELQNPV